MPKGNFNAIRRQWSIVYNKPFGNGKPPKCGCEAGRDGCQYRWLYYIALYHNFKYFQPESLKSAVIQIVGIGIIKSKFNRVTAGLSLRLSAAASLLSSAHIGANPRAIAIKFGDPQMVSRAV
jgi:hypothetical protein